MGRARERRCHMRGADPDPTSLIRDKHHQPQSAWEQRTGQQTDGPDNYGPAINRNEFDTPVRHPTAGSDGRATRHIPKP
ncbi:hypothetical protein BACT_0693 [Bifidobacterium actinocoloniiforme DSM 22766]|uniref:Uncharacterized protein n=1 Tax=Bifidobacterium actinocoloniiforme DSM 22766 TaxID=1437605 RepID=A0A086Z0E2_9BIFI|nr:hypothetical protein BACT_0693 [Bifidobacterium actinocoloniiforme DSM 22766]